MKIYEIAGNEYVDAAEAQAEIDALKAQRDELLADLRAATEVGDQATPADIVGVIKAMWEELRRLLKQADALKAAQRWQPIESAPRDGTRILLFFPNDVGVISGEWNFEQFYANPKPHFTHDQEQRWGVRHMRANQPTHWQPLPLPPAIAKARGDL